MEFKLIHNLLVIEFHVDSFCGSNFPKDRVVEHLHRREFQVTCDDVGTQKLNNFSPLKGFFTNQRSHSFPSKMMWAAL